MGLPPPYLLLIDAHGMRTERAAEALRCVCEVMSEGFSTASTPSEEVFVRLLHRAATALAVAFPDEVEERKKHPNVLIGDRGETALSLLFLLPTSEGVKALHLGNVRLYHYRAEEGVVFRSRDNSFVADLFDEGEITFGGMSVHPRRHLLTRALIPLTETDIEANPQCLQPVCSQLTHLRPNDLLLLATAGFVEGLSDQMLTELLAGHSTPSTAFEGLIDRAERNAASIDTWVEQKTELDPADLLAADALGAALLTGVEHWVLPAAQTEEQELTRLSDPADDEEEDDPRALPLSKESFADSLRVFWRANRASFFWTVGIVLTLLTGAALFDKCSNSDSDEASTEDTNPSGTPSDAQRGSNFDDIPLFDRPPLTPPRPVDTSLPTPKDTFHTSSSAPASADPDLPPAPPMPTEPNLPEVPPTSTTPAVPSKAVTPTPPPAKTAPAVPVTPQKAATPTAPAKAAAPVKPIPPAKAATPAKTVTPTTPQKTTPRRQQDDEFAVPLKES